MRVVDRKEIEAAVRLPDAIEAMREALLAHARGACDTPMPMHLDIVPGGGEVHVKASSRRGGEHYAVKIASGFPGNVARGLPAGSGMMILFSAASGEPVALLADEGWLTDLRTAAVAALAAREIGRRDATIGILGSGIQARLQARLHAEVLPLERVVVWGRTRERVERCLQEIRETLPRVEATAVASAADLARTCRLIVTATASRHPLLHWADLAPGTHLSAVGSDAPGKQELDPEILGRASLLLVDSRSQCERLGELQHAREQAARAIELGEFLAAPSRPEPGGVTVCDFTGLGVEDLHIAERVWAWCRR